MFCPHCSPGMLITPRGGGGPPRLGPVLPALLPGREERSGAAEDKACREWIKDPVALGSGRMVGTARRRRTEAKSRLRERPPYAAATDRS